MEKRAGAAGACPASLARIDNRAPCRLTSRARARWAPDVVRFALVPICDESSTRWTSESSRCAWPPRSSCRRHSSRQRARRIPSRPAASTIRVPPSSTRCNRVRRARAPCGAAQRPFRRGPGRSNRTARRTATRWSVPTLRPDRRRRRSAYADSSAASHVRRRDHARRHRRRPRHRASPRSSRTRSTEAGTPSTVTPCSERRSGTRCRRRARGYHVLLSNPKVLPTLSIDVPAGLRFGVPDDRTDRRAP